MLQYNLGCKIVTILFDNLFWKHHLSYDFIFISFDLHLKAI